MCFVFATNSSVHCVVLLQDGAVHTASRMCIPSAPELLAELEQLLLCPISHVRSIPFTTSYNAVVPHHLVMSTMCTSQAMPYSPFR